MPTLTQVRAAFAFAVIGSALLVLLLVGRSAPSPNEHMPVTRPTYMRYASADLERLGLQRVGRLFVSDDVESQLRADLVATHVPAGTALDSTGEAGWFEFGCCSMLGVHASVNGRVVTIYVFGAAPDVAAVTRTLGGHVVNGDSVGVSVSVGTGRAQRYLQAALDHHGYLFVEPPERAASSDVAVEYDTRETLDLSRTTGIGNLGVPTLTYTTCRGHDVCEAHVEAPALIAPADGQLSCASDGAMELETPSGVILRFAESARTCLPPSRSVKQGDILLERYVQGATHLDVVTQVTARDHAGRPLSVAMTEAGAVHVGEITTQLDCPCIKRF